jgi:RNA 2',3'-cyclic 3'-phosphodiesterase
MHENKKRVFFGVDVKAPWPDTLPHGRLLAPEDRHATLAFLGEVSHDFLLQELQKNFPTPSFKVGIVGHFSKCLFLPPRHPNVVAWEVEWMDPSQPLLDFRQKLLEWLRARDYHPKEHEGEWLCHVTLCRKPFHIEDWKKSFRPLPLAIHGIHLYESLGHSSYKSIWSYALIAPFQEIEHTADIAFLIHGENLKQIHQHAQSALAFRFPALIPFMQSNDPLENHDDIIMSLNTMIAQADAAIGCPFKAISFHGQIEPKNSVLQWEMIVDV